jgi:hypothetical protein
MPEHVTQVKPHIKPGMDIRLGGPSRLGKHWGGVHTELQARSSSCFMVPVCHRWLRHQKLIHSKAEAGGENFIMLEAVVVVVGVDGTNKQ